MLLRNGKRTRKEILVLLPLEIQKKIFSKIDLYLFSIGDRSLQKYLIANLLLNDTEAVLCWAIGRKDRWLIKQILKTGFVPGNHSREAAVLNNLRLDNLLIPIDNDSTRLFYLKHHLQRGEILQALEYYDDKMNDVRDCVYNAMQTAIKQLDPGIMKAINIWPDLLHGAVSFSCMYGKTDILRELHRHNMLQYYFHHQYFVYWAICGNFVETVKYLLEIGFHLPLYDHKEIGSIFQHGNTEMLELVFRQVEIPDNCLEQGVIAAAESGKMPILQFLVSNGVDCNKSQAVYRSATRGHIETYYYLSQLATTVRETS